MQSKLCNFSIATILSFSLSGCQLIAYLSKPIDPQATAERLTQKSLDEPNFIAYLAKRGISVDGDLFTTWNLETLHATALFFHADLVVAKEKLALAEYSIQIAAQRPGLGVNGGIGRSDRANNDINPMSYALQIDIPFETTSKRAIKIEEAEQLAEVARMDAAEIAWNIRHQIYLDLIAYQEQQSSLKLLQLEMENYAQLISMLQKRVAFGMSSNTELSQYQLLQQKNQIQLRNLSFKTDVLLAKLAADIGLTLNEFKRIPIAMNDVTEDIKQNQTMSLSMESLQSDAVIHRIDIRRALARYAASEAKLKLEVAKQIPDISLSPGYAFEFGDRVWSLGFSTLLNMLQQQPKLIQQAEQLRAVEGAQFEAIQASAIAQTNNAWAQFSAAKVAHNSAHEMLNARAAHIQKIQNQFDAGLADRLILTQAKLILHLAEQDVNTTGFEVLRQYAHLENTIQRPLTEASKVTELIAR